MLKLNLDLEKNVKKNSLSSAMGSFLGLSQTCKYAGDQSCSYRGSESSTDFGKKSEQEPVATHGKDDSRHWKH